MKTSEIFGLLVRAVGVVFVYQTVHALIGVLTIFNTQLPRGMDFNLPGSTLFHVVGLAGAAVWFLFGAPPLQKLAYPDSTIPGVPSSGREQTMPSPPKVEYDGPPCVSCGQRIPAKASLCPHCGWTQP